MKLRFIKNNEEGRRKKEEGRRKREEGRRKKEEGRGGNNWGLLKKLVACFPTPLLPYSPTPLLPYSPTPLLHYSPTPLLPYSPTPPLPHSPTPLRIRAIISVSYCIKTVCSVLSTSVLSISKRSALGNSLSTLRNSGVR
ncbi:MAG: hypothetical protein SWX82_28165 [Cyanobacteriota bacterium]|nr:hypothetical protein [Cyanobacteriota bacterium]